MIFNRDLFAVIHLISACKHRKYMVKRARIDFDQYDMCTTQHGLIATFTRLSRDGLIERTDGKLRFLGPAAGDDTMILGCQFALSSHGKLFARVLDMLVLASTDKPPAWAPIGSPMLSWRSIPFSMRTIAEGSYQDIRALASVHSQFQPDQRFSISLNVTTQAKTCAHDLLPRNSKLTSPIPDFFDRSSTNPLESGFKGGLIS